MYIRTGWMTKVKARARLKQNKERALRREHENGKSKGKRVVADTKRVIPNNISI